MPSSPSHLSIRRPDDWHVHLRDGDMLRAVLPATASVMGRAMVMPNLLPPVVTTAQAAAYRDRITALLPTGGHFTPLMTAYLTDHTDPDDLARGYERGVLSAVKLYPAGATTNSDSGVTNIDALHPVFERLERLGMPLLVHGELTSPDIDIFDREAAFLDQVLGPLLRDHPALRVVLEHLSTTEAVEFVRAHAPRVAGTITAHHLLANRNDLLVGGIKPHLYCLPVLKHARHQRALVAAATSGDACFFLGTDSAPHTIQAKQRDCGSAGCFTAASAIALYAQVFDSHGALDRLEGFASQHGPSFHGLPQNTDVITLVRDDVVIPQRLPGASVRPFMAGLTLRWRVEPPT